MNLLEEWLQTKKYQIRDYKVKIGELTFHIPFDGQNYLMFKCAKCGWCCHHQPQNPLLLTWQDAKRISRFLGYKSVNQFLEKECLWLEAQREKVYFSVSLPPLKVSYAGFFLKRFPEENEETARKPHPCRFLNENNRCSIYPVRPAVCVKAPYTVFRQPDGFHAYYSHVPWSQCRGYRAKKRVKLQWLSPWVNPLIRTCHEIWETVRLGMMQIIRVHE